MGFAISLIRPFSEFSIHRLNGNRIPNMKTYSLTLPLIGLISGTRAIAGSGLALLLADRLKEKQRHAVGWTLLSVGLLTTIPLVALVVANSNRNFSRAKLQL